MPFPMKIQPIDFNTPDGSSTYEPVKPVAKSGFKRLFERQFGSLLRISAADKSSGVEEPHCGKDGSDQFEPSSVCLAKMVQSFIEDSSEKQSATTVRCCRKRGNCFNGICSESSEDELDSFNCFRDSNNTPSGDACETLKSLVRCTSVSERNLLADTANIVEKNKICKRKDDLCRKTVTDSLFALGYDTSICKSRWEKSPSYPAGDYDYMDVIVEGERLIIDIDFRSEFEIARPTKTYKAILQTLPHIFVGKSDRLQRIIHIIAEAAKQSLKKKGMPLPPWRKAEYVGAKWLSSHTRATPTLTEPSLDNTDNISCEAEPLIGKKTSCGEFEMIFREKCPSVETDHGGPVLSMAGSSGEEEKRLVLKQWEPPAIRTKSSEIGVKIVTGFASAIEDNP